MYVHEYKLKALHFCSFCQSYIEFHVFEINYAEGNESSSFLSDNKIMSSFSLMTYSKNSNLFFMELRFKCPIVSFLEELSFISARSLLASLIPSRDAYYLYHLDSVNQFKFLLNHPHTFDLKVSLIFFSVERNFIR